MCMIKPVKIQNCIVRLEVFAAMTMKITVFWVGVPCSLVWHSFLDLKKSPHWLLPWWQGQ